MWVMLPGYPFFVFPTWKVFDCMVDPKFSHQFRPSPPCQSHVGETPEDCKGPSEYGQSRLEHALHEEAAGGEGGTVEGGGGAG